MPGSTSSLPRPEVVARLRAAGCVFAEDEAGLLIAAARNPAELARLVDQRAAGMPLEQVLGWAEFCGLRIAVEPGVFAPRRRTEFLAGQAIALACRDRASLPPVVVDLCCGSGAVAAAVAAALPGASVHAVDIDPAAVRCARRNLTAAEGQVYQGDLYQPLPPALQGRVDVLIANAPYVPTAEVGLLPAEARRHEPRTALDGGGGGGGGPPPPHRGGWRRAATCWWRPARGRQRGWPGLPPGMGWCRGWSVLQSSPRP